MLKFGLDGRRSRAALIPLDLGPDGLRGLLVHAPFDLKIAFSEWRRM